ncbi:MAG: hypothetical protein LUD29_05250 [Clostridia bacterium]|nr:hypothetical protein [Clostridia bacterium]
MSEFTQLANSQAIDIIYIVIGSVIILALIAVGVYTLIERRRKREEGEEKAGFFKEQVSLSDDADAFTGDAGDAEEEEDVLLSSKLSDDDGEGKQI